jgi:hypothetical protein
MNKGRLITIITFIVFAIVLIILDKSNLNKTISSTNLNANIYTYLKNESNQKQVQQVAMNLNDGKSSNACVYFVSEVLRKSNFTIPNNTANTTQMIALLQEKGWNRYSDYKKLKPGDICFTTDYGGSNSGKPTHTYVFMSWVKEGNYDYAYICDNQAKDYSDNIYHIRNIKNKDTVKGITKEAFSFFMRPSHSL